MSLMGLSSITTEPEILPPRIVLYGTHGIGKTTFGASAPSPILIRTEDGIGTIRCAKFPIAESFSEVMQAIRTLYTEEHPYKTVVFDSLDWLEPLIWSAVALEEGKDSIEDIGYGKGYKKADDFWQRVLEGLSALRERGMTVICIAHAAIKRFDAPDSEPYDRYKVKLHDRAADIVQEWADVVAFAHYETTTRKSEVGHKQTVTRGVGAGTRLIALEERPAYHAKNRYNLPHILPLSWDAFAAACAPSFTQSPGVETPEERAPQESATADF